MNESYLLQIENPLMKERLLTLDKVSVLEDLLNSESIRLKQLQELNKHNKLNFGGKLSICELNELFPQICTQVDDFLGIQDGKMPKFGYYDLLRPGLDTTPILLGYYLSAYQYITSLTHFLAAQNPDTLYLFLAMTGVLSFAITAHLHSLCKQENYHPYTKKITLGRTARTGLILNGSHEYDHSIQHRKGIISDKYSIFMEGHARGVQKHLAKYYQEIEDNEAFLYWMIYENVYEFTSAYLWMCKKLKQQPRKSLLKTETNNLNEGFRRLIGREPTPHAKGNALFSIYEAMGGREIYKRMIHGNFEFP